MFILSKVFWWIFEPANLVMLLFVVGTALLWTRRWRRMGRRLVTLGAIVVLAISIVPFGTLLIAPLEDRFPALKEIPEDVAGIITLGGAVNQFVTASRDRTTLNDAAERLTEFVALARQHPGLRLVYTGGSASLTRPHLKEVTVAQRLFAEIGLDPARVIYEDRSRNTYENAIRTKELVRPGPRERWVLVTSAFHMPRAVGVFRAAGWNVVPYPVDYQTDPSAPKRFWHGLNSGLNALSFAMHEWIGLLAYWLLGRSDDLFPGPNRA